MTSDSADLGGPHLSPLVSRVAMGKSDDPSEDTTKYLTVFAEDDPDQSTPENKAWPAVTVMSGYEAGRIYVLENLQTVLGRSDECHIQFLEPTVSRKHVRLDVTPDGVELFNLRSRNGVFVNGEPVQRVWLSDQDLISLGGMVTLKFAYVTWSELKFQERLFDAAVHDTLTRLFNKRYFLGVLERRLDSVKRRQTVLGLLILDLDNFKRLNDTYGHLVGDQVLQHVSRLIKAESREKDVVCRYGGEEFMVLLNDVDAEGAARIAERIRCSIEHHAAEVDGVSMPISVSIGVAAASEVDGDVNRLISVADVRLYSAKRQGRNRVCTETDYKETRKA